MFLCAKGIPPAHGPHPGALSNSPDRSWIQEIGLPQSSCLRLCRGGISNRVILDHRIRKKVATDFIQSLLVRWRREFQFQQLSDANVLDALETNIFQSV